MVSFLADTQENTCNSTQTSQLDTASHHSNPCTLPQDQKISLYPTTATTWIATPLYRTPGANPSPQSDKSNASADASTLGAINQCYWLPALMPDNGQDLIPIYMLTSATACSHHHQHTQSYQTEPLATHAPCNYPWIPTYHMHHVTALHICGHMLAAGDRQAIIADAQPKDRQMPQHVKHTCVPDKYVMAPQ
jgi:hypothetical protein